MRIRATSSEISRSDSECDVTISQFYFWHGGGYLSCFGVVLRVSAAVEAKSGYRDTFV